jgi:hypothetical protein
MLGVAVATAAMSGLQAICRQGGYQPAALRIFDNPLLSELFARLFD